MDKHSAKIRQSNRSDHAAICNVHLDAFGHEQGTEIAALVTDLFADETAKPLLSLVAEVNEVVVGHILFTRAMIESDITEELTARILAPLAVSGRHQGKGIGRALIKEGLHQLAKSGVDLVFVLGHPMYYRKSGFRPAGICGLEAPYTIPSEHADAWMFQEICHDAIDHHKGKVRCANVLDQPQHWRE